MAIDGLGSGEKEFGYTLKPEDEKNVSTEEKKNQITNQLIQELYPSSSTEAQKDFVEQWVASNWNDEKPLNIDDALKAVKAEIDKLPKDENGKLKKPDMGLTVEEHEKNAEEANNLKDYEKLEILQKQFNELRKKAIEAIEADEANEANEELYELNEQEKQLEEQMRIIREDLDKRRRDRELMDEMQRLVEEKIRKDADRFLNNK